jgi:hypothetical protein
MQNIVEVKKKTNMTTIYETYLEQVKEFDEKFPFALIDWKPNSDKTHDKMRDIKDHLRQSFIAMVEGELQELKRVRLEEEWDFEVFCFVDFQISRLTEELNKLKNERTQPDQE